MAAVDISAVARVVGIEDTFVNLKGGVTLLPQRVALIGQGSTASTYATTKQQVTSAAQVGTLYGFGSPIHLASRQLLPANGDGIGTIPLTVYPLEDDGSGVAAAGLIDVTGDATESTTITVKVNNVDATVVIVDGDSNLTIGTSIHNAVSAVINMPVTSVDSAGIVDLTAKWAGTSSNDLVIEVDGEVDGVTFAITQPIGGLVNPDVDDALNQVGNIWETMIVNCMDIADTVTLDKYVTFNEGRWNPLVAKPLVVFTGNTEAVQATSVTVPDARPTDRTNSQLVAPGSDDLPFVVAARQVARITSRANNNPPYDYGSMKADGLTSGTDAEQWDYLARDAAVKAGSSTIEVKDGVVNISDVITFYKPTGEEPPAYRFVVDIVKRMQELFNLQLIFASTEWDGKPLIPDAQPTTNRDAKKPRMAVADIADMIDSLGLQAIISDPETAKATIFASISESNPKRIDVGYTNTISGNANIISIASNWGFFFGTPEIVA